MSRFLNLFLFLSLKKSKISKYMEIAALASGSSGNCFYVGDNDNAVLIDAGISCKQIMTRMNVLGKSISELSGIFVTHEHSDHIRGIDVLARKFKIPIYATKDTILAKRICMDLDLINPIKNDEVVRVGNLKIEAFSKSHDAADPVSYSITESNDKNRVSVITDIGHACQNVIDFVSMSDALFMESNHDIDMLDNGPYPYFLKNRIKSNLGHISNIDSASCVSDNAKCRLKHVILSHLSKNNNTESHAMDAFNVLRSRKDLNCNVLVSNREMPTRLFRV